MTADVLGFTEAPAVEASHSVGVMSKIVHNLVQNILKHGAPI